MDTAPWDTGPQGVQAVAGARFELTFGRLLRAVGALHKDGRVRLGHTDGSMTSHYAAAELSKLIKHVDRSQQL